MKRFALIPLVLLAFVCVPCTAGHAVQGTVIELPFTVEKGHVIVPVKIKGNIAVEMILATGAEHSMLDAALLEKYKLPAYYAGEGIITGSSLDRTYTFTTVPDLSVGDLHFSSLNMRLDSQALREISKRVGRDISGVLGADFFKGHVVQFDFGKKMVRFLPKAPANALKGSKTTSTTIEYAAFPMNLYREDVPMPVIENVAFDGRKIKTLLDTGAVTVISLSSSAAKQVGLEPPTEGRPPRVAKINSLRFGELEFTDVPATLSPKGSEFDREARGFGAVAGVALLQNFVVTFDFRDGVVILERI